LEFVGWLVRSLFGWLVGCLVVWLLVGSFGCFVDFVGWLIGWFGFVGFAGWLISWFGCFVG
jgi:hypothetical protein